MLKKIFKVLKKFLYAAFILYCYNIIAAPLNILVPINVFNVSFLAILGLPALFSLIAIYLFIF